MSVACILVYKPSCEFNVNLAEWGCILCTWYFFK